MLGLRSTIVKGFGAVALCAALLATHGAAADSARIAVVHCPTEFGISGKHPSGPSGISVSAAGSADGLVAYSNTEVFLLGPRGLRCSGIVAADGGSGVIVWAQGQPKPGLHSHGAGLTLDLEPACAGCRADDACPFFQAFARKLGFPCAAGVPPGEIHALIGRDVATFEDPPGVAGSGWPSGGRLPANGVVGVRGATVADALVYRSTCTLPAADHAICTESLNDVIARYG
jgi:hypothetical protein